MIKSINFEQYLNNTNTAMAKPSQAPANVELPDKNRNYTIFDTQKVNRLLSQKEGALPYLKNVLANSQDEKEIVEALYITDRLLDSGVKGIPAMYPLLSKFNNTESANIQTFLAGIYRKTQVPDAFGPLVKMLVQNSSKPTTQTSNTQPAFDPNEEIGGAILEYISTYSKEKPKIDYSA